MRLLVMACSASKYDTNGYAQPAISVYRGPGFKVLHRHGIPDGTAVVILSAKHGLIPSWRPIADYDTAMDDARAAELSTDPLHLKAAAATIARAAQGREITDCHCFGGKLYHKVACEYSRIGLLPARISWDSRGIGFKLQALKTWLDGAT